MEARMKNPAMVVPDAMEHLLALSKATEGTGLSKGLMELLHLRASQINSCGVCVDMHAKIARKRRESDERLFSVSAWRETPYFTDAERAALALTEAVTRMADTPDAVPDEIWNECARHFDQEQLAALTLSLGIINLWNRLNVTTRQMAGEIAW